MMKEILLCMAGVLRYCISIFFGTAIFLAYPASELTAQTHHKQVPTLKETKAFLIYAKKGNYKAFDASSRDLIKNEEIRDFRNGELLFIITDPNSAILSANTGLSDVAVARDNQSLTFIETTPAGNKHIMIIKDTWDAKEDGFKFTYTRNTGDVLQGSHRILRSLYSGIAKPAGQYKSSWISREASPAFQRAKIFLIYAKRGNFKSFDLSSGKLLENKEIETKDLFANGELQYAITGPNSAIFSGNAGSAEVDLVKGERTFTFIETTPSGSKHIMIIEDKWDAKEKGFKFTYIRNTITLIFSRQLIRSISSGIAKPADW
jgi:hypothetical protein